MGLSLTDYGLWDVVFVNTAVFLIFAFSFARPRSGRDWRSFGAFSGFLVALFAEMYGFPLTVYLLSGWLGSLHPATDLFAHNNGHIWQTLLGWEGDPHGSWLHLLSDTMLGAGFLILAVAWPVLYRAQKSGQLATRGAYRLVRHPQYVGFVVILVAFLLQWPTIPTLLMFPVLVTMYVRLARREEREALERFGEEYARYAASTPAFLPRPGWLGRPRKSSSDTHEAPSDIS
ncbi:MAG TPA: isoprenylcysteine carboxylmethyltransferase family protein [Chloroflexota bacterium]|nr:isoprenylcysteine carboxylmethyltransferase family protein [Chloroflexota bacterium]